MRQLGHGNYVRYYGWCNDYLNIFFIAIRFIYLLNFLTCYFFEDKVKVFRVYRRIQDNVALFERALFEGVQDLVHVVVRLKVHQQPHISCGSAAIEPRTKPAGRTIA